MVIIIIGLDHSLFMEECLIHSTHFGDIMTPFILDMVMDMVMGMHMVITLGGGHTTHGIIITLMEETLIQMYHLSVVEEVQEI